MQTKPVQKKRWVIKVGSALITADSTGLHLDHIHQWSRQIAALMDDNVELVLVSSGSIAEGMHRLQWTTRPTALPELQAAAAVGQMGLVKAYESELRAFGSHTAQILLTHEDLSNRKRYLNAKSTLGTLLSLGVLPVINENDTVTTDEIRVGDNDNLAALVANLITADQLIILTDQQGLFDKDPGKNRDAKLIATATAGDPALLKVAGPSTNKLATGGMQTKVLAAERAARSGTHTVIASGREPDVLLRLHRGESIGTRLQATHQKLVAHKMWLGNQLKARGTVRVDSGAFKKLTAGDCSLLPIGVTDIEGEFRRGELVSICSADGEEVARGLVNYNASEAALLAGCRSDKIRERLGYANEPELVNRDNMVTINASHQ